MNSARYRQLRKFVDNGEVEIVCIGYGYAHTKYKVLRNDPQLDGKDLAIIADKGNLPFGYRAEGDVICVYTD